MNSCPAKQYLESIKEYYVEQINTSCLSQFSYYIESNGEAAIIDPIRESDYYMELINKRKAKLKYIIETHFHADFVSGHLDLARKTGAQIVFGPSAQASYAIKVSTDYEKLPLGNINLQTIHTPGHTLESSCFVIVDNSGKEKAVFTGDTVFLGEVGRPDLAVGGKINEKDLAGMLYDSIQKLKKLPDEVIIFPGHGAGSSCGKSISKGSGDTLFNQKLKNYAFNDSLTRDEFIRIATSNLPTPPQYFFYDAAMNREGYEDLDNIVESNYKPLDPEHFLKLGKEENTIMLDTRDFKDSQKSFLKGSIIIPLNINYAIMTAILFNPNTKFILITDKGKEREAMIRLARVGYQNTIGYLEGGYDLLTGYKKELITNLLPKNESDISSLIDVREIPEYENEGIIENSSLIPLSKLKNNINEISNMRMPIGLYCKSGVRSTIAGSILKKYNINNVFSLGGFKNMVEKGYKVIKYVKI